MRRLIGLLPLLHGLPLLAYLLFRGLLTTSVPDVVPERQWWRLYNLTSLLNEFTPFFFLPLPLWPLTALLARTKSAVLAAALPWALFAGVYGELFIPRPPHLAELAGPGGEGQARLRVMTFNVLAASRPADDVIRIIKEADPDVVVTQEAIPALAEPMQRGLDDAYPFSRIRSSNGWGAQAIWSRVPILQEERWDGSQRNANWQHAILDLGGRRVHLINLHLSTPSVNWRTVEDLPVPVAVGESSQLRSREVAWLVPRLRALTQGSDPVIVAGDFNLTDQTPEFRRLLGAGLRDAYRQAGWGFGLTFPATPRVRFFRHNFLVHTPLIGIDHVLLSSHLEARRAVVWPESGQSDHRPVVVDLVLK
jgi:endonuclease/exonuclease/phosphatase family metal-dependent hydrolase